MLRTIKKKLGTLLSALAGLLEIIEQRAWALSLLLFIVFFFFGLLITFPSLNNYWFWDDLHLIRVYSPQELGTVFHSNWDLDGIETPGYRPLTILFYHTISYLFGEQILAYRIAQLALYALALTLFSLSLRLIKVKLTVILAAGLLSIATKNNWYNLAWLTDSVRGFIAVLQGLALIYLLTYISLGKAWRLILSLIFAVLSLLTREDALAFYPILVVLSLASILVQSKHLDGTLWNIRKLIDRDMGSGMDDSVFRRNLAPLGIYFLSLFVWVVVFFIWRNQVLPDGASMPLSPSHWIVLVQYLRQNSGEFLRLDMIRQS